VKSGDPSESSNQNIEKYIGKFSKVRRYPKGIKGKLENRNDVAVLFQFNWIQVIPGVGLLPFRPAGRRRAVRGRSRRSATSEYTTKDM
jgi:hypothetical protein